MEFGGECKFFSYAKMFIKNSSKETSQLEVMMAPFSIRSFRKEVLGQLGKAFYTLIKNNMYQEIFTSLLYYKVQEGQLLDGRPLVVPEVAPLMIMQISRRQRKQRRANLEDRR
ncbi:unnamed protein product [Urochloa humidicola]